MRSMSSGRKRRTGAGPPWTWARLQNRSMPSSETSWATPTKPTWPPGRGAAGAGGRAQKRAHAVERDVGAPPHEAEGAAGGGRMQRLIHRPRGPARLDDRVRPEPAGELLDRGHAGVAALLDDVGRAE